MCLLVCYEDLLKGDIAGENAPYFVNTNMVHRKDLFTIMMTMMTKRTRRRTRKKKKKKKNKPPPLVGGRPPSH